MLGRYKHSSLLGPFMSYEENEVLWIRHKEQTCLKTVALKMDTFCKLGLFRELQKNVYIYETVFIKKPRVLYVRPFHIFMGKARSQHL